MDSRSPKRRKTTPPDAVSTETVPARTPTRASFLSPTKASLARFNPGLLPRAGSNRRSKSRGASLGRQQEAVDTHEQFQASVGAQAGTPPVDEEDGLPLTPTETGLQEKNDLPQGILYSSPSKRRLRGRTTSPLRPKAPPPMITDATVTTHVPDEDVQEQLHIHEPRGPTEAPSVDPELQKKEQEKGKLVRELEALQVDITKYEHAVEISRKAISGALPDDFEIDQLISLINNADPSVSVTEAIKATPISSLLSSFLPFSKPPPVTFRESAEAIEMPIPSHAPLDLNDPLPYLRLLTPFAYKSEIGIPKAKDGPSNIVNHHQIHTVDITEPKKLFAAGISFTVDTSTQQLVRLSINRLSPWAERELGTWIRKKAREKDLGAICWSLGSYWEVAGKRAECWNKCQDLLEDDASQANNRGKVGSKSFGAKRKGRTLDRDAGSDEDAEGSADEEDAVAGVAVGRQEPGNEEASNAKRKAKVSRKQLMTYLGRESMVFETSEAILKISWTISFDWTGEAESNVKASAAFPRAWHDADARSSLKKVPTTFDSLVQDRGVYESIKAMVGLLFG